MRCLLILPTLLALALPAVSQPAAPPKTPVPARYTAYLMAYFGPEQKLFYAVSRDARHWTALNGSRPVLDPGTALRDPFLNRVGGTFHLVHTMAWDNPVIYHWQSPDLIHWQGGPITVVAKEQKRAWAPEFFFVPTEKLFYVFWASKHNGHNTIYYTTTRDWSDITPEKSAVYYDLGIDDIDFDVVEHAGTYYAFHKPGTVEDRLGNTLSTSRSLNPKIDRFGKEGAGKEGAGKDVLPGEIKPIEGPEVLKLIGQNRWYIYGDPFHAPLEAWQTTDFVTFTKISVSTPDGAKHCSMIAITEAEMTNLQAAYPVPTQAKLDAAAK